MKILCLWKSGEAKLSMAIKMGEYLCDEIIILRAWLSQNTEFYKIMLTRRKISAMLKW